MEELPSQKQIIADLKSDREQALAKYFSMLRSRLEKVVRFRLDYRLKGRVSESDILQETYVRAAQRLDSFLQKPSMPIFVWLRLETQQHLLDVYRKHFEASKRDVRKEISFTRPAYGNAGDTSMALAAHLVAQMTSVSQIIEKSAKIASLEDTLNEMSELDREVIALRHFEELSNIETAEVLGIEPSAASKRYLRALKRLREILELLPGFQSPESPL
jgi:RNA polymerase sigma-70 factor (ECF subfamily)